MAPALKSKIAIIGGGPAGCICAYFLKQKGILPDIFEKNSPLKSLLPTGGGRCNLAHAEFDMRGLAANYPRGEKFLYSVFSKFGTSETLEVFEKIGVKTYVQEDLRIFPESNSSAEVRRAMLDAISGVRINNECVSAIKICNGGFEVKTDQGAYFFEKVIVAIGGHSAFEILKGLGHTILPPVPALTGLKTFENFSELAGVSVKNVSAIFGKNSLRGDLLFTHEGVSGPLIYTISSIMACEKFPYKIILDFAGEIDLQTVLNENPHKSIKNILSDFVPKALAAYILVKLGLDEALKGSKINGKVRDEILKSLNSFEIETIMTSKGGEVVTCGGVSLDEVNSKTMQSKLVKNLFFCGEVLDIDGFCGGFNLQNCWSTGFLAAHGVLES
ncbi:aminoacetone oxidase family FAD-binding enzyme [bacterium]|nr:aminoacetone oxidase family FAD-binding enzyme [bacterium]